MAKPVEAARAAALHIRAIEQAYTAMIQFPAGARRA
jgi:hypothetical protein